MLNRYTPTIKRIAQAGLVSKGVVYMIFGILLVWATYGTGEKHVQLFGIIRYFISLGWLGRLSVTILSLGLLCYSTWKFCQMVLNAEGYPASRKNYFIRITWMGPFLFYLMLGFHSVLELSSWYFGSFTELYSGGDSDLQLMLFTFYGKLIIALVAFVFLINAGTLFYLAFTGKYRIMLTGNLYRTCPPFARVTGFVGYLLYGLALLIIAGLFFMSIIETDPSMAEGTYSMFELLIRKPLGALLLTAIAIGTFCYGFYFFSASFYRWNHKKDGALPSAPASSQSGT